MARGWESKSVEAQIESSETERCKLHQKRLTSAQMEMLRKKEALLLSRTRITRELEGSRNPRYTELLKRSLADLEGKLSQLDRPISRAAEKR